MHLKPATIPHQPLTTRKPKPQKMPVCRGDHEIVLQCGDQCQLTCDTYGLFFHCNQDCQAPACGCATGYVRDKGQCIPPTQCPRLQCHANETLAGGCFDLCENKCGKAMKFGPACLMHCDTVKCICKEKHVRNENGTCVKPVDCPGAVSKCRRRLGNTQLLAYCCTF